MSPTVSPAFPLCPWQLHVTVLVLPPLSPVPVLLSWCTASSVSLFCFPMSLSCPLWAPATPVSPSHALCLRPVLVDPSHPCPILSPMSPSHPRVPVPSCMDPVLSPMSRSCPLCTPVTPVSPILSPVNPSHSHVPVPSPVGPILSPMSLCHPRVPLPSPVDPIDPHVPVPVLLCRPGSQPPPCPQTCPRGHPGSDVPPALGLQGTSTLADCGGAPCLPGADEPAALRHAPDRGGPGELGGPFHIPPPLVRGTQCY